MMVFLLYLGPTSAPTTATPTSPSLEPTNTPTDSTDNPTVVPTKYPTVFPTNVPTHDPSTQKPTTQPTFVPTPDPTNLPTTYPTKGPTVHPTINPTAEPSSSPTESPTNNAVSGYWYDDFLYADKTSVDASGTSDVYDIGWYVSNILFYCKHQRMMHFVLHSLRIVWNGNDYYDDTHIDAADAVTIHSDWMVVNDSVMVNHDAADDDGDLYFWRTLLDRIGYATTPTSGYTESELGGSLVRFHGPFQRRMLLGTVAQHDAGTNAYETGKWVHLMRY